MALIVLLAIVMIFGIAGVRTLIIIMENSPEGWEDKNGFHFGKKKFFDVKSAGKTG